MLLPALSARVQAGGVLPTCARGAVPAATLLVPYFEVDLADAGGKTTLVAVTNAGGRATLAHVVLWTDWGVPTLAFDLALGRNDVQSLNLRDLFAGVLPVTGGASFPGCIDPLALPVLDAAAVAALRLQHTGRPDAQNRCSGSGRAGADVATGYLTVDVTQRCSATIRDPTKNGYFEPDGIGVASNDNLLVGDFFLLDASQDLAVGNEAVAVVADAPRFGGTAATFYGAWIDHSGDDARAPLGTRYRARFLNGGPFTGGTELVVWAEPSWATEAAVPCGDRASVVDPCQFLRFTLADEESLPLPPTWVPIVAEVTAKFAVGGPELPVAAPFGFVDVENRVIPGCLSPIPAPNPEWPLQSFVIPLHRASGRFAVGLNAALLREELCPASGP